MAQVDFYVLTGSGESARQQFACRLAEKAYRLDHKVHIQVADATTVEQLDALLWTFRDGSFLPHESIESGNTEVLAPVTIGYAAAPPDATELLINLGHEIPENISAVPRVAEVVTSDEGSKTRSRQHFISYREQGHTLNTHKL